MRKIKLYIAASLNSKIASADGSVEWLEQIPNPDETDYGYAEFYQSVDSTIMGYKTYKQIIDWDIDFPYPDKKNYILTTKQNLENTQYARFVNENQVDFIRQLKEQEGQDIWLIGGGQVNTLLFNEDLVDEIHLFVMPIVLSEGIALFEALPIQKQLKLITANHYTSGTVELRYSVINS